MDRSLYPLIDKFVDSISSISEEVKCLRKAIEGNGNPGKGYKSSDNAIPVTGQAKPVILDFDEFVRERDKE